MTTRYVVTHLDKNGYRTFAHARQGRLTYPTREAAQAWIQAAHEQNGGERLATIYGLPLAVRACECYPEHFDPIRIIFERGDEVAGGTVSASFVVERPQTETKE